MITRNWSVTTELANKLTHPHQVSHMYQNSSLWTSLLWRYRDTKNLPNVIEILCKFDKYKRNEITPKHLSENLFKRMRKYSSNYSLVSRNLATVDGELNDKGTPPLSQDNERAVQPFAYLRSWGKQSKNVKRRGSNDVSQAYFYDRSYLGPLFMETLLMAINFSWDWFFMDYTPKSLPFVLYDISVR